MRNRNRFQNYQPFKIVLYLSHLRQLTYTACFAKRLMLIYSGNNNNSSENHHFLRFQQKGEQREKF